jgi:hypothetical protein
MTNLWKILQARPTGVEQSTQDLKREGSNPAATGNRRKQKKVF